MENREEQLVEWLIERVPGTTSVAELVEECGFFDCLYGNNLAEVLRKLQDYMVMLDALGAYNDRRAMA